MESINAPHWHLLLNHAPIFGGLFSIGLMLYAFIRKDIELKRAALWANLVTAIVSYFADSTGGAAARIVINAGLVSRDLVREHRWAADVTLWVMMLAGFLALLGLVLGRRVNRTSESPKIFNGFVVATFVVSLAAAGLMGWVSELGGEIRHTEMHFSKAVTDSLLKVQPPQAPK